MKIIEKLKMFILDAMACVLNLIYSRLPLSRKIVASAYVGRKYGDNPQYILESIHRLDPSVEIVWIKKRDYDYAVPEWIRVVNYEDKIRVFREYLTASVWLDSHHVNLRIKKRKDQIYLETWHGGLGIKKIELDVPSIADSVYGKKMIKHTADNADVFISNSDFLSRVYRSAFNYRGTIWKTGYPKTDILLNGNLQEIVNKVKSCFGIERDSKILLYAPTFREWLSGKPADIASVIEINYEQLYKALEERFGGDWVILVRLHPNIIDIPGIAIPECPFIIDTTKYPEMQELIISSDILISDYSSCLFDAAVLDKACFTYTKDYSDYKIKRGTYYDMDELPFPWAEDMDQLVNNILGFEMETYLENWHRFRDYEVGLYEPGNASETVARLLLDVLNGDRTSLNQIIKEYKDYFLV